MPGYVYNGSTWVPMTTGWVYNGNWVQIKEGWAYTRVNNVEAWRQIFSSGTFSPLLRLPGGTSALTRRSLGLNIELYRGSNTAGSYAYQFQYASGQQTSWTNQTGTNNSGTLTGATTTTNYATDSSDLAALEALSVGGNNIGILDDIDTYRLQEAKNFYMRARVIKSGETQFTQNIRIHKRQPVNVATTLTLQRLSTGLTYTLTGNPLTDKQPYVGDTIYWTLSFQNTTTITNDTRPDYYWFNFSANSGDTTRNSILSTPASPRTPDFANRSYVVKSTDVNGPIVCNLKAVNTNGDGTGDITIATRDVSDGSLTAPQNLVLTYQSLALRGQWDAAGGGNDNTITYTWYLQREINNSYTQVASGNTTSLFFTSSQTTAGNYRFYVVASQSGNASVTSGFSNIFVLQAPAAFNVTIQNITNTATYQPSVFSINAPTLSATDINRWIWTWGTSTITGPVYRQVGANGSTITGPQTPNTVTLNNWTSQLTRPNGTTNTFTTSSPTDFWTIDSSGNHTETVTANNNQKNYVRISWTRPAATSAVSYRVRWTAYIPSGVVNTPAYFGDIIVGDITSVDVENTYNANGAWVDGSNVAVTSVTAYNGDNATGVSTSGTIPPFSQFGADGTTSWSPCNIIGTKQASRVDNLTLESASTGFLYITGTFEPGNTLSLTGTSPVNGTSGWSPDFNNPGWSHAAKWYRSGTVDYAQISGATSTAYAIPNSTAYIGDRINASVISSYKGQLFAERFDASGSPSSLNNNSRILPPPPTSFTINDNGNRTFSVTNVSSFGATQYFGTYSGVSSGTITETPISNPFNGPQGPAGTINITLNARRKVNLVYPSTQTSFNVDSSRTTSQSATISPSPQDTSSRRFLSNAPSISAGNTFYISTNGYFGNALMPTNNYFLTIPSPGGFLNIAAQDLVMQSCFTKVDNGGVWVRYRGNRYLDASKILEYQAYLTFSGTVYVLFIENSLTDYVSNTAYTVNGSVQNTWASSSSDTSSFTINQGTTGWTSRSVTSGSSDDGVVSFTVIRPARQHQAGAVTRTAGGFTFQITNVDDGLFESAATYGVSTTAGSASINASTGLVTQTGLTSSQFATVTVSKVRTGYDNATNVVVQGQALAGSPPSQVAAPSISPSGGSVDASGTPRRAEIPTLLTGSAGSYNNQQSITSQLLTITSVNYTGLDSDWTSAGGVGTSVSMNTTYASSSANMFRFRDRVVGTDGSTVDFYSSQIYRAVYGPPTSVFLSTRSTSSITLGYTGSGSQRIYAYKDGNLDQIITSPAVSGASGAVVYSGLSAGTSYSLLLYGANNEGYISINAGGSTYSTLSNQLATPTGVSATTNRSDGINISWNAVSGAAYYGIWWGPVPGYDSAPDFGGPNNAGGWSGLGTSFLDTTISSGSSRTYYVQAYQSGNPTGTKSNYSSGATGTRTNVVSNPPGTPTITGNNSLPLGGTFSWTFSGGTAPFTYSVFCSGPSGTVYTTSNQYTWGSASFRPAYDGTGGTNGTGWQGAGTYQISVSVRDSLGLTSSAGAGSTFMS